MKLFIRIFYPLVFIGLYPLYAADYNGDSVSEEFRNCVSEKGDDDINAFLDMLFANNTEHLDGAISTSNADGEQGPASTNTPGGTSFGILSNESEQDPAHSAHIPAYLQGHGAQQSTTPLVEKELTLQRRVALAFYFIHPWLHIIEYAIYHGHSKGSSNATGAPNPSVDEFFGVFVPMAHSDPNRLYPIVWMDIYTTLRSIAIPSINIRSIDSAQFNAIDDLNRELRDLFIESLNRHTSEGTLAQAGHASHAANMSQIARILLFQLRETILDPLQRPFQAQSSMDQILSQGQLDLQVEMNQLRLRINDFIKLLEARRQLLASDVRSDPSQIHRFLSPLS